MGESRVQQGKKQRTIRSENPNEEKAHFEFSSVPWGSQEGQVQRPLNQEGERSFCFCVAWVTKFSFERNSFLFDKPDLEGSKCYIRIRRLEIALG